MFKLNEGTWDNILELREVLELQTVKIAAEKATDEEIEELGQLIKQMKEEIDGNNREKILITIDQKFHNKIASISKNYLIENFFKTSSRLFEEFIEEAREKVIEVNREENLLFKEHNDIYKVIKDKNPELAYYNMKEHMDLIRKSYNKI